MPKARVVLWIASLAGIALCARSVLVGPVPLGIALAGGALYLGLVLAGVLVPRLEMFGDVVWEGPAEAQAVALTFDDGPCPSTTPLVLAELERASARATFFVLGEKAERYPEVVRAIAEAGHELGVHGYRHHWLYAFLPPRDVEADVRRAVQAVEKAAGVRPSWFRPPVGQISPRTAAGAARAGVTLVGWSVRGLDGVRRAAPAGVERRVIRGLRNGAIVALHDAAESDDYVPASLDALPRILAAVARHGLRAVTLTDLVRSP